MSRIAAILGTHDASPAPTGAALRALLGPRTTAGVTTASWRSADERVSLLVEREEWERSAWLSGDAVVARRGAVTVVADASIYARRELVAELRRAGEMVAEHESAAGLIAAVYRISGAPGLLELNGDFAFALWDGERRLLLLGRDFAATRPLHFTLHGGRLLAATTLEALMALRGSQPSFDRLGLAEAASGVAEAGGRSCYANVSSVPAGCVLAIDPSLRISPLARWDAPTFESGSKTSFTDAAMALRDILWHAVADRMAPDATAVWMSGGYDSSSLFATARSVLACGAPGRVESISVRCPVGDGGREDKIIDRILTHHRARGRWIDGAELPLLGDVSYNAARRDEPFAAMYDGFFRRASQDARDAGARVALSGHGGDVLFDSSMIYLADLFEGLHLRTYLAEWRAARAAMWRPMQLVEETLAPLVPERLGRTVTSALGRRKERLHVPAPWLRGDVARRIADTGWMPLERRAGESRSSAVARWSLTNPFFTRSQEAAAIAARREGVEYRMPLLDRRVLALAATRPRWEKRSGVRAKSLLRAAMKGMLPEEVLLPRPYKTGLTRDYLMRGVQREFPAQAAALQRQSALADLGIIDPSALSRALAASKADPGGWVAGQMYFTFQTEHWLRHHSSVSDRSDAGQIARAFQVRSHEPSIL